MRDRDPRGGNRAALTTARASSAVSTRGAMIPLAPPSRRRPMAPRSRSGVRTQPSSPRSHALAAIWAAQSIDMLLCSRSTQATPKPAVLAMRTISVVLALRIPTPKTGVPARSCSRTDGRMTCRLLDSMRRRRRAVRREEIHEDMACNLRAEASPDQVVAVIAVGNLEHYIRNAELVEPGVQLRVTADRHEVIVCAIHDHGGRQARPYMFDCRNCAVALGELLRWTPDIADVDVTAADRAEL